MPTSRLLIRTWPRSAPGRSHHFPWAVRGQPPPQHEGLTGTLPAAVRRDRTVKARHVHCLSPSLRFPLTFHFTFLQSPLTLHPLCCCPFPSLLSPKQKKKKNSFPTLVSSLPSSDPGRSLLLKHSTEFRVKWLTQICFDYLWWIHSRKTSVMRVI